jgi:hypothetical protein
MAYCALISQLAPQISSRLYLEAGMEALPTRIASSSVSVREAAFEATCGAVTFSEFFSLDSSEGVLYFFINQSLSNKKLGSNIQSAKFINI